MSKNEKDLPLRSSVINGIARDWRKLIAAKPSSIEELIIEFARLEVKYWELKNDIDGVESKWQRLESFAPVDFTSKFRKRLGDRSHKIRTDILLRNRQLLQDIQDAFDEAEEDISGGAK